MEEEQQQIFINGVPIEKYDFEKEQEIFYQEFVKRQRKHKIVGVMKIFAVIFLALVWLVGVFCLCWFSAPEHTIGYLLGSIGITLGLPLLDFLLAFVLG